MTQTPIQAAAGARVYDRYDIPLRNVGPSTVPPYGVGVVSYGFHERSTGRVMLAIEQWASGKKGATIYNGPGAIPVWSSSFDTFGYGKVLGLVVMRYTGVAPSPSDKTGIEANTWTVKKAAVGEEVGPVGMILETGHDDKITGLALQTGDVTFRHGAVYSGTDATWDNDHRNFFPGVVDVRLFETEPWTQKRWPADAITTYNGKTWLSTKATTQTPGTGNDWVEKRGAGHEAEETTQFLWPFTETPQAGQYVAYTDNDLRIATCKPIKDWLQPS